MKRIFLFLPIIIFIHSTTVTAVISFKERVSCQRADLDASVKTAILSYGYKDVQVGDVAALVGHWGLKSGDHLQFRGAQS